VVFTNPVGLVRCVVPEAVNVLVGEQVEGIVDFLGLEPMLGDSTPLVLDLALEST